MKKWLLLILITIAAFFIVPVAKERLHRALLFHPHKKTIAQPEEFGFIYEDVWIQTEDQLKLHGWWVGPKKAELNILYFHGNGGNISYRLAHIEGLVALGARVLMVDYRGYGQSEGSPTTFGLYKDANAAYRYLTAERQVDPNQLVVYGESLGAALAIYVASEFEVSGLVVENGFTSLRQIASHHYPWIPSFVVNDTFNSKDAIKKVDAPILVIHADKDKTVPKAMGEALYNLATPPRQLYFVKGAGHSNAFAVGGSEYIKTIERFFSSLSRPSSLVIQRLDAAALLQLVDTARGKVVLLNLWATWCLPCREEFPWLVKLREEYANSNFELLFASVDFSDELPQVQRFLKEQGVTFPTYVTTEPNSNFINTLHKDWSGALPASFIFDAKGSLRYFLEGETSEQVVRQHLLELLSH